MFKETSWICLKQCKIFPRYDHLDALVIGCEKTRHSAIRNLPHAKFIVQNIDSYFTGICYLIYTQSSFTHYHVANAVNFPSVIAAAGCPNFRVSFKTLSSLLNLVAHFCAVGKGKASSLNVITVSVWKSFSIKPYFCGYLIIPRYHI